MKHSKIILLTFFLIGMAITSAVAQGTSLHSVKKAIEKASKIEQEAFQNGDCTTVLDMMANDITFLANGNKVPSKQVVEKFCNTMKRPFPEPLVNNLVIYPLTEASGYTVKTLEYEIDGGMKIHELVTKIWKKTDGIWKITHLHSTVKEIKVNN